MNWLKQNWLKLYISLSLLVVLAFAIFLFIFYIPKQKAISALKNQKQCYSVGEKAFKADINTYGNNIILEPEYKFSEKLNTCLYSGGYSFENLKSGKCGDILKHTCDARWERWVKDAYTNNKIIDIFNSTNDKGEWTTQNSAINDFWEKYEKLFGHR